MRGVGEGSLSSSVVVIGVFLIIEVACVLDGDIVAVLRLVGAIPFFQ